jgi:HlyD family secretion protein
MIMRGRIGLLILVLAIAAGLVYGFYPRAIRVDAAEVKRAPLEVTVDEEGKTRVRERYIVSAPVGGYAQRIDLKVGDPVRKGQVVAVIEPSRSPGLDPRSRAQALAQLAAAEAALAATRETARAAAAHEHLAQVEYARSKTLGQSHFLSPSAVDQAHATLQAARADRLAADQSAKVAAHNVEAARATAARAPGLDTGKAIESIKVVAPVSGRVLGVPHESEGAVQPGQELFSVGDANSLEVVVEVLSTAAVKIRPGTAVRLARWGGEPAILQARVREVEPAGFTKISALGVEEQRVRVICDITSPAEQWTRLGDAYRVEASFVVWSSQDALQVPTDALFRYEDGWAVYTIVDGRAQIRAVKIGQRNGLQAELMEGLKAGAEVISRPGDQLKEGARVEVRDEG